MPKPIRKTDEGSKGNHDASPTERLSGMRHVTVRSHVLGIIETLVIVPKCT